MEHHARIKMVQGLVSLVYICGLRGILMCKEMLPIVYNQLAIIDNQLAIIGLLKPIKIFICFTKESTHWSALYN